MGLSNGKIAIYNLEQEKLENDPVRLGGETQAISKILAFTYIEDSPVFLVVIDDKELYLFNEKTKAVRQIDYGEKGEEYKGEIISSV
jgi:hypothetical protein